MDVARRTEVLERWNLAVEALQHQIVGALQAAARRGVGGVARQFVELVADPADDAVEPALDGRMRRADEQRRGEFLVEHQRPVVHLDDARDRQPDEAGLGGLADLIGEARIGDLDLLLDPQVRRRVDHGLGPDDVAGRVFRRLRADLARVVGPGGHGQPDELAGGRLGRRDRRRGRALAGKIEQPAVRHDPGGPAQPELALLREVAVDLEPRESPRVRGDVPRPAFERVLEVAIGLLQMMGAKEQALRPVNLGVPRHARSSPSRSGRALRPSGLTCPCLATDRKPRRTAP